jgi:hypothetical protein
MRFKKSVLLFEVAIVVLLVTLSTLFLFRGYGIFLKVGRKSLDYIALVFYSEQKLCDIQLIEETAGGVSPDIMEKEGDFDSSFSWNMHFEEIGFSQLQKCVLETRYAKRNESLDMIYYLFVAGE